MWKWSWYNLWVYPCKQQRSLSNRVAQEAWVHVCVQWKKLSLQTQDEKERKNKKYSLFKKLAGDHVVFVFYHLTFHIASSEKKLKMEMPLDPVIPTNPESPIQKNLCTPMFIAALFAIPSVGNSSSAHQ